MSNQPKQSREEWRKAKDLDAARKAGTAPAELDEEGNEINPHIPQYMVEAPWYVNTGKASLKHQRAPDRFSADNKSTEWYDRGATVGKAATKYRKGACENCGAMSHKAKECMEKPRAKGARWTGKGIRADEVVTEVSLGYEGKRDRWNGYDPASQAALIEEHALVEEARKKRKAEELDRAQLDVATAKVIKQSEFGDSDDSEDDEEDKYAEAAGVAGQKFDTKTRVTVRNLRIREDTAKYLMNLDPTSAHYDPKTRSMRGNPNKGDANAAYVGDNFHRQSGDTMGMRKLQSFAWSATAGADGVLSSSTGESADPTSAIHLQANPTASDLQYREYLSTQSEREDKAKTSILDHYGGAEHLDAPPQELMISATEHYVEYSRTGEVLHGREAPKARSKYEEDTHPGNHTAVWGSWWGEGSWGYACCHLTSRQAYCVPV